MSPRLTTERVRELLAGDGCEDTDDLEQLLSRDDRALLDAAPDLAADLLDARARLAAVADALELQPTATPEQCVDAAGVLSGALASALNTLGAQSRLLEGKHTPEDGIHLLVSAVLSDADGAPNSAEFRGTWLGRRFHLTVQWADGQTPGEMLTEMRSERDAALARALTAEASTAFSARAAVDAARELGHVAAAAVARADALAAAVREEREARHARVAGKLSGAAMVRARAALDALLGAT